MTLSSAAVRFPIFPGTGSYTRRTEVRGDPRSRLFAGARQDFSVLALHPVKRKLEELRGWPDNWDGYGSIRPVPAAIDRAISILPDLYQAATKDGHTWTNPHVTASEDGEVVLEWWSGNHKLTVYISPYDARYVRVWGPHVERDMDDGELATAGFDALWHWLSA